MCRKGEAMLRFLAIIIFLLIFLILTIPVMIVEWILNKWNPALRRKTSNAIVKWGLGVCVFLAGTKITTIGLENIPQDTAVLYVGNHRSYFDIMLLAMHAPGPLSFLSKKEMLRYPLLCHWMKLIDSTFIDRNDIKQGLKVILKNIELLKELYCELNEPPIAVHSLPFVETISLPATRQLLIVSGAALPS